jgi:hypothetical protein
MAGYRYLYGEDSRMPLKITRDMLTLIFTYHQVMPKYLEFMFVFGAQSRPVDLRFSGFREQTMLSNSPQCLEVEQLGRSGRQFQLCYSLKGVTMKSKHPIDSQLDEWSIRQAAFLLVFDVVYGTTLWVVTKGGKDIQQIYKDLTGAEGKAEDKEYGTIEQCFRSSLAVHLLFCYWATQDWRWYIRWMENIIEDRVSIS